MNLIYSVTGTYLKKIQIYVKDQKGTGQKAKKARAGLVTAHAFGLFVKRKFQIQEPSEIASLISEMILLARLSAVA